MTMLRLERLKGTLKNRQPAASTAVQGSRACECPPRRHSLVWEQLHPISLAYNPPKAPALNRLERFERLVKTLPGSLEGEQVKGEVCCSEIASSITWDRQNSPGRPWLSFFGSFASPIVAVDVFYNYRQNGTLESSTVRTVFYISPCAPVAIPFCLFPSTLYTILSIRLLIYNYKLIV
jgi:hypothetical protein